MFQGHEDFISQNSCYFFQGVDDHLMPGYPWEKHPELLRPTLCKIASIEYKFPDGQALDLLHENSIAAQIVIEMQLETISNDVSHPITFEVRYVNSEAPEFLIPRKLYENSLEYVSKNESDLLGQTFKTRIKDSIKLRIIKVYIWYKAQIGTKEQEFSNSTWETIEVESVVHERRNGRGGSRNNEGSSNYVKVDHSEHRFCVCAWDLAYDNDYVYSIPISDSQTEELSSNMIQYVLKNQEFVKDYLEFINEKISFNYLNKVPVESNITLIRNRVEYGCYRTIDVQFFHY